MEWNDGEFNWVSVALVKNKVRTKVSCCDHGGSASRNFQRGVEREKRITKRVRKVLLMYERALTSISVKGERP